VEACKSIVHFSTSFSTTRTSFRRSYRKIDCVSAGEGLGTDKSRGYCLEMICADFLGGAHLDNGNPEILLNSLSRYYEFLPGEQQKAFLENLCQKAHMILTKGTPLRLDALSYESLRQQILRRDGWRCQCCGTMSNLEVHHREFRSHLGSDSEETLTRCARHATPECMAVTSLLLKQRFFNQLAKNVSSQDVSFLDARRLIAGNADAVIDRG